MKHLYLLFFFLPFNAFSQFGVELNGGTNMHKAPIGQNLMKKGSKPSWTVNLKAGWYFKKLDVGMGTEHGRWEYSRKESGAYYGQLEGNNYSSLYAFTNYSIINKGVYVAVGASIGRTWLRNRDNNSFVMSSTNYVASDGSIPASSGAMLGMQLSAGYNLTSHVRLKMETSAQYWGMIFKYVGGDITKYEAVHFPMTLGIIVHDIF